MGGIFGGGAPPRAQPDPELARQKAEAERKATEEREAAEARKKEEALQSSRGNRGTRALFSGDFTGFDTLSPRGFFRSS